MNRSDKPMPEGVAASTVKGSPKGSDCFGKRIREYRTKAGFSQEELGFMLGVGKNAVGAWESGRSRPDLGCVSELCRVLNMPLPVFFGRAEGESREQVHSCVSRFRQLNESYKTVILREMDALIELQTEQRENEYFSVPRPESTLRLMVSDAVAAAGFSPELAEAGGQYARFPETDISRAADEVIRVNGDSMEPEYSDGDYVYVRHAPSVQPGEIGIFMHGNEGYIKKYMKDGLYSLNPAYPPLRFDDEVVCVGKVIGKCGKNDMIPE